MITLSFIPTISTQETFLKIWKYSEAFTLEHLVDVSPRYYKLMTIGIVIWQCSFVLSPLMIHIFNSKKMYYLVILVEKRLFFSIKKINSIPKRTLLSEELPWFLFKFACKQICIILRAKVNNLLCNYNKIICRIYENKYYTIKPINIILTKFVL